MLQQPLASSAAPAAVTTLSGTITDPSGALIPHAVLAISVAGSAGPDGSLGASPGVSQITTDPMGHFSISLPAGTYDVAVSAVGFDGMSRTITLGTRPILLDLRLTIATTLDEIDVPSNAASSTAAADNKSSLIFRGDQLNTLSDNDNTMQQQVLAMAGGGGEGGGSIYVDGFSGGRFPPKDTIREIRINQNPFSSQYEDLGYGRVEIFTKPGSDKVHGNFSSSGSTKAFNSLNPYTGEQPPYYLLFSRGDVSGPLGKKTSAFLSGMRDDQQNNAVVNAFNPDGSQLSIAVSAPTTDTTAGLRIDRQLNTKNTLVSRYEYSKSDATNSGVGLLVLPSEGINTSTTVQTFQIGNTQLVGPKIVSETRFQYLRTRLSQTPASTAPTIVVQGAFNGGGAPTQASQDSQDQFEFQEYLSFSFGNHFLRTGARYRLLHETNISTANFNGQYTFPTLAAYQAGTPSLFSLTAGKANAELTTGDLGAYAEDEWKIRKNITAVFGLRLESQTAIPDHFNPAPRAGITWAVGQTEKHPALFTIRGSAGIFYQRFAPGNILTSIRQNGISQQAFLINNPSFYPNIPSVAQLSGVAPTPYSISPHLRVASENIASLSIERSLGKDGKLGSVNATYYAVRGVHQYNSENVNAAISGSGARPLGGSSDVYQFASDGIEKAQSLNLNTNLQLTKRLSVFAFYSARRDTADTSGAASFPSQPYNVSADYGPSGLGFRPVGQRLFADADVKLPFNFSSEMFLAASSHSRFDITTGTDRNNDTQFNDRPAFATNPGPTSILYATPFGTFDANPQPGEAIIPHNYGIAPRLLFLAMGVSRQVKFGPRPAEPATTVKAGQPAPARPDPAYNLSFGFDAVNVLNTTNGGTPIGVLSSPFFGRSISTNNLFGLTSAANRIILLHTSFRF
ncbi:TonB-dependent receptor [Granulicella arctica]|uniref:TonB-dependent receptor n=1 Tax=Granulicella arctica TaxID=940613 RepID=UPI0021E0DC14|nr:TonB-dependent receptor [Granulicella arctica]